MSTTTLANSDQNQAGLVVLEHHPARPARNGLDRRAKIPDGLWHEPEMAEILGCRDIGAIFRILQRLGISQRRIAMMTGQSQSEVSEILAGRKVVTYDLLERIARGLAIPRGLMGLAYAGVKGQASQRSHELDRVGAKPGIAVIIGAFEDEPTGKPKSQPAGSPPITTEPVVPPGGPTMETPAEPGKSRLEAVAALALAPPPPAMPAMVNANGAGRRASPGRAKTSRSAPSRSGSESRSMTKPTLAQPQAARSVPVRGSQSTVRQQIRPVLRWTGAEVRALRQARRMTVREFAAHLGVTDRMVSKWEAGRRSISPRPVNQSALDTSLARADSAARERFLGLLDQ